MARRREGDSDWHGAAQRSPWDGPTTDWGQNVDTRMGRVEVELGIDENAPNGRPTLRQTVDDIASTLSRVKKVGVGFIAILAFLGFSSLPAIWHFFTDHWK